MPRVSVGRSREILREKILYERYGGYMNVASVMAELGGVSRPTAMKFLADIPSYNLTGKKLYDIADIAAKIEGCRVPAVVSR